MPESESPISIGKNTPITLGLVLLVVSVSSAAIFKAGQVLTEFDYLKTSIVDVRSDIGELKRTIQRLDRNTKTENYIGEDPKPKPL